MKRAAIILSVLVVFLAFGLSYVNAMAAEPDNSAVMQDDPKPGMMTGDHQCKEMMGGMEMKKDCGCGKMGEHMMGEHMRGGMQGIGNIEMMMPENIMETRRHAMRIMMHLGLNAKQKESADQIIDGAAKDLIKKGADLQIAKIELENILHKDPVDMNAAASKLKQIEAIKTDMFLTHLKALEEIKSMLTPQQKKELKEMMEGGMGMEKGCKCGMMEGKKAHHGKEKMTK